MPLRIYNTLTRRKEEFVPLYPGEVRIYSCGVTVYDRCHVGHARSAMVFDVICRYLAFRGDRVTFVRNFTDVEDKIIRRAQQEGVPAAEISERYIREFQADMEALGVLPVPPGIVYHDPRATEHVPAMVELIERLVSKGYAYVVDGDVYFEIARFPRYGWLSGKNLDELLAGARVEVDERKRDPRDFALWKAAKPGEPSWPSPWGAGRPGWHIECSVMSTHYLGESLDIHGGGTDLIFPHHECEIAQTEADTGRPFARYWVHNGLVNLGAEKMSKSLGNILTIKELMQRHSPEALRMYLVRPHYKSPLPFSELRIRQAAQALQKFYNLISEVNPFADSEILSLLNRIRGQTGQSPGLLTNSNGLAALIAELASAASGHPDFVDKVRAFCGEFENAMDDDFNTPKALGALYELRHAVATYRYLIVGTNRPPDKAAKIGVAIMLALGRVLSLFQQVQLESPPAEVEQLVTEREAARKRRDWKTSDVLREEILRLGWTVEDTATGPRVLPRRGRSS